MLIKTKYFGKIDLNDEKIISFEHGIMGFEEYKKFTIIYELEGESKDKPEISWLQSLEEPSLAIPIINPFIFKKDYNPIIEDEVLKTLGELNNENLVVLLTLTVPQDIKMMSVNLKAPFIINSDTRKGCQIIVENQDYEVKYKIYDILQKYKEEKGEI